MNQSLPSSETSSAQWFAEAARCYLENHQGCPWCGGSHRVFKQSDRRREIYCCQGCDFQVSFDLSTNSYNHIVGEEVREASSDTMCDQKMPRQSICPDNKMTNENGCA